MRNLLYNTLTAILLMCLLCSVVRSETSLVTNQQTNSRSPRRDGATSPTSNLDTKDDPTTAETGDDLEGKSGSGQNVGESGDQVVSGAKAPPSDEDKEIASKPALIVTGSSVSDAETADQGSEKDTETTEDSKTSSEPKAVDSPEVKLQETDSTNTPLIPDKPKSETEKTTETKIPTEIPIVQKSDSKTSTPTNKDKPEQAEKAESSQIEDIMKDLNQLRHDFRNKNLTTLSGKKQDTKQLQEIEDSVFDQGADFEDEVTISDATEIELSKVYELNENWMTVNLPDDKDLLKNDDSGSPYLILTIKGYGHLSVRVHSKTSPKHANIHLDSTYEMSYLPIDRRKYLNEKDAKLQIRIEKGLFSMLDKPKVKAELKDCLEMEFNQNQRVYTNYSHEVRYKVTHPEKHLNEKNKQDRLQFILQSSLNEQTGTGKESLSMYINSKPKFPASTNYDLKATGNLGYGLIKTLGPQSSSYCIKSGCEYYVTIFSHNIDALYFFPTVFANGSKLKFHRSFFLLEEVEGTEMVYYQLEVPYHDGDWLFSIQPMEGKPKMTINPDEKVDDLRQAKYKTVGNGAEEITISAKEAKLFGFSHKRFFVAFEGSGIANDVATFKFNVLRMDPNEFKHIKLNYAETGVVANKEISNYKLKFNVEEPEFIDFRLKMLTLAGSAVLVVKECEKGGNCEVKMRDVNSCRQGGPSQMNINVPTEDTDYDGQYNDSTAMENNLPIEADNRRILQGTNSYNPYSSQPVQESQFRPNQQPVTNNSQYNNYQVLNTPQYGQYPGQNQFKLNPQPSMVSGQPNTSYSQGSSNYSQPSQNAYNSPNYPTSNTNQQAPQYPPEWEITAPYQNPEMLTQNDLNKTDIEQLNMTAQTAQSGLSQQFTGGAAKIPEGMVQHDRGQHLIKPEQDLLTSAGSKSMMEKLASPILNMAINQEVMLDKDMQLRNIKDYRQVEGERENNANQDISQGQGSDNGDSKDIRGAPGSSKDKGVLGSDSLTQQELQQPPKEFDYNLQTEIDPDYLRCVEGNTDGSSPEEHSIIMKFNCLGPYNRQKGKSFEHLDDSYPYSNSCSFAVGVFGSNPAGTMGGTYYSLEGSGGKTHKSIKFRTSSEFIIQENEIRFFRFDLKKYKPGPESKLRLKVVAITGSCKVYLSRFNQYPSEFDNESSLNFDQEHFMSVRTSERTADIPFDSYGSFASLFAAVDASEYCVLDFYAEKLDGKNESPNEKLHRGKLVKRKLTGLDKVEGRDTLSRDSVVYARGFHFKIGERPKDYKDKLHVVLNSNVLGLRLCVQRSSTEFVPEKRCDFSSEIGEVIIPNMFGLLEGGSSYAIGVLLEVSESHARSVRLPVDFSIIYFDSKNSGQHLQVLDPGRAFSSHVSKHDSMVFKINLLEDAQTSLIVLTTEDKMVKGQISKSAFNFADGVYSLDTETFAVELDHFREQLICDADQEWACFLYVKITSSSKHQAAFSLTYTVNEIPITLKEGHQLFIPNRVNMYFLYDPNPLYPAELDLQSDLTQFILYAKMLDIKNLKRKQLKDLLSEYDYDYKTDIGKREQLRVPQAEIKRAGPNSVLAFLVAPKFNRLEGADYPILYSSATLARLQVKSRMSKLEGFVEGDATLKKGEFRHFFFEVNDKADFSLVLTVQTGRAGLYLNKGLFNLPTLKDHWKKGGNGRGQEIIITPKMFSEDSEISGVYTAGIYAVTDCRVAVMFLPSFPNLVKARPQHVLNLRMEKNKDYYFEFYNRMKVWELLLYASDAALDVSIMDFALHKNSHQDMVDILRDDSKYLEHLSFTKGSLPLKHRESTIDVNKHYVVRVKTKDPVAHLDLAIYDPSVPLLVPAGQRLDFITNVKEKTYFKVELAGDYESALLDFTLIFGSVDIRFSDSLSKIHNESVVKISVPRTVKKTYKPKENASDIQIFDGFYLLVEGHELSKFRFSVRGRDQYKEIRPFENELVYTSTKQDKFIYFQISKFQKDHSKHVVLDIDAPNSYSVQPLFFFNPDSEALSLDSETKFLPMPMMDVSDSKTGAFRHIEIRPELQAGYYIVKLPKAPAKTPVRLSLSLGNRRTLQTNGTYRFRTPADSGAQQKFSLYLPKPGEFRLLVESCDRVSVKRAELNLYKVESPVIFKENLIQTSHYIVVDDRDPSNFSRMYKNFYTKVFRGQTSHPGALEFVVEENENQTPQKEGQISSKTDEYLLITEFKPDSRNLFFKDYINLWGDAEEENIKKYSYSWSDDYQNLNFDIDAPQFHDQLLQDFPDLKRIVVKYFVYALKDADLFARLETCGLSALDLTPHSKMTFTQEIDVTKNFNAHQPLRFQFASKELSKFRDSPDLYVFSYLAVSFYENELDQFELGLETKFATSPYVCFVTRNMFDYHPVTGKAALLIVVFILLVLSGLYCKKVRDSKRQQLRDMVKQSTGHGQQYTSPQTDAHYQGPVEVDTGNKIEMSDASS